MRRIRSTTRGVAILFIVWSVMMAIGAAVAQVEDIVQIPVDTVVRGEPGSIHLLAEVTVPAEKVGAQCSVHETSENNRSVHPNTDLIVTSGGGSVTLFDVEREGGGRTDGDGLLTLGETARIDVRLGADGVFSGGFIVGLCQTIITCGSPALSIGVAPPDQEVVSGGDANFDVTVTNTGDEPFLSVNVDSSVAACDLSSQNLLGLGQTTSYSCTATGVTEDLAATFAAAAVGQDPTCSASASAGAAVTVLQACNSNPALTITVVPGDQDVPDGGDADFQVTVTNTGDEDMVGVAVDSSVAACDNTIGALAVGAETSYACKAAGVETDLNVSFAVTGEGVTQGALCSASDDAAARVGNPPPPTTTTTTTTTPRTPTGVPTGTGDGGSPTVPVAALVVAGLGLAVIGAGTYRVTRREH